MKKRNLLLVSLTAVFAAAIFFACSKDEDEKTKTELLTAHAWKISAATCNPAYMGSITDLYALMQSCQKDDFYTFTTNGTMIKDEGPTKCNEAYPQTVNGTWEFAENEAKIIINKNTQAQMTLTIISLSENQATFSTPDYLPGYTVTFTYVTK